MPRHAATTKSRSRRSTSAQLAYRAGTVDRTIDLTRPHALTVSERAWRTANRYGAVLCTLAAMVWLFDVVEAVSHR